MDTNVPTKYKCAHRTGADDESTPCVHGCNDRTVATEDAKRCLEGLEGGFLHHEKGVCDCPKRPGYEAAIHHLEHQERMRKLAAERVAKEQRDATLYDRVEAWQKEFLRRHFSGSHGSASYYGDAASGLAIALQEIDRDRYDRTSSQVWVEAQNV